MWPASNLTVAAAAWTSASGQAMTGSVKDARAAEVYGAARERLIACGLGGTTNLYAPRWYLWERQNLVRLKAAAAAAMPYYAARWLADGDDFTAYCAAQGLAAIPVMTASNVTAHLGIRTNFFDTTPWVALNAREWDAIRAVYDLMTWTVTGDIGSTNQTQTAGTWYDENYGKAPHESWAEARAQAAAGWAAMASFGNESEPDPEIRVTYYSGSTNSVWPAAWGPSAWTMGEAWTNAGTTYYSASASANSYWPAFAAATNFDRAGDWYHAADTNFTVFSGASGMAPTMSRLAQAPAGHSLTTIVETAVGPSAGFPKDLPTWCAEPSVGSSKSRGYGTASMQWVLRWDADSTNGFRFR